MSFTKFVLQIKKQALDDIINFSSIKEYNAFNNQETMHPLVSVVHLDKAAPRKLRRMRYEFYTIFLKQIHCGDLRYGLGNYDYEEGTLIFLAPGQVIGQTARSIISHRVLRWCFIPIL